MIKACVCAAAMMVGAMIGANAPAEWRGNAPRLELMSASSTDQQPIVAMAYRPHQR